MSLLNLDSSADNSLCLHLCDFGIGNSQTAAAVTHHRVELVERLNDSLDLVNGLALSVSQLLDVLFLCGNELVERRIEETDGYGAALESFIESLKVALLIGKDLVESSFSLFNGVSADHLSERSDSVLFKEHVLCTAETDTLGAELSRLLSVSGCVSVSANLKGSELVCPSHDSAELTCDLSVLCSDSAVVDVTGRTVD